MKLLNLVCFPQKFNGGQVGWKTKIKNKKKNTVEVENLAGFSKQK